MNELGSAWLVACMQCVRYAYGMDGQLQQLHCCFTLWPSGYLFVIPWQQAKPCQRGSKTNVTEVCTRITKVRERQIALVFVCFTHKVYIRQSDSFTQDSYWTNCLIGLLLVPIYSVLIIYSKKVQASNFLSLEYRFRNGIDSGHCTFRGVFSGTVALA